MNPQTPIALVTQLDAGKDLEKADSEEEYCKSK